MYLHLNGGKGEGEKPFRVCHPQYANLRLKLKPTKQQTRQGKTGALIWVYTHSVALVAADCARTRGQSRHDAPRSHDALPLVESLLDSPRHQPFFPTTQRLVVALKYIALDNWGFSERRDDLYTQPRSKTWTSRITGNPVCCGLDAMTAGADPLDGASFGVDMTSWQHLGEMSDMRMISSMTSSLSSPVDSGVALLDSDGDGTSVSEATINEMDNTDNLSLRDCKEDDLMYTEIEDNCINHKLLSSGTCQADHKEISSDTTKTTLLNTIGGWSGSLETEESTETSNFSAGLPVDERGIPEGQEDPPKSSSTLNLYPFTEDNRLGTYSSYLNLKKFPSMASSMDHSDLESMFSDVLDYHLSSTMLSDCNTSRGSQPDLQQSKSHYDSRKSFSSLLDARTLAYKTSILNRFMKSLAERRNNTKKIISFVKPTRSLYIKGIKQNSDALKPFIEEVEAELKKMEADSELSHDEHCLPVEEFLESSVFVNKNEALYKVFRVRNSYFLDETCQPLLVLMTDTTLYVTGSKNNDIYYNYHVLPYKELDAIIVMVATGNRLMTEKLVGHLEVAMRRASQLPAVRQLQLDDMRSLYHWLAKEVTLSELSNALVVLSSTAEDGEIEVRISVGAGVVYMFNEKKPSIPKRVIPIRGKHCCGCRRIPNAQRPHTFEILIGPRRSFQFAAADEYEASDWLQAFVQSASGVYEMEHVETVPCTLLVTSHRILTCKEQFPSGPMHVLSCARIRDVLCIGTVSDQHSWCMLKELFQDSKYEPVKSLNLFVDAKDVRLKTRISEQKDVSDFRYSALLPSDHPVVTRLIHETHVKTNHVRVRGLLSLLRERFLIVKATTSLNQRSSLGKKKLFASAKVPFLLQSRRS
uniref:PH domain-containing protein n=1 Tax=Timema shepardi TaxID=629360 RepID=A0A7R9FX94_TIMSH|nr:unnamed protein product [Timema shepardi]